MSALLDDRARRVADAGDAGDLLARIRELVLERKALEWRGAGDAELAAHAREVDAVRERLAALVAGGETGLAAWERPLPPQPSRSPYRSASTGIESKSMSSS